MMTLPKLLLLTLAALAGLITEAKPAQSQPEEHQRRASRWDQATAERLFRKGAWREGIAYLGRALRLNPQNSAAARHLWSAVVDGGGDRNTLPALVLRQEAEIHVAVFSPDGRRILTASADKTARLWDATTGAPVGEPMRHEDEVVAAVFSPDGTRIATASKDGTARLWDAATGKALGAPMRHEHPLDGVAFNSTGTRIVTQSNQAGVARLWDAAAGAPIGEAMPHSVGYSEAATFSVDGSRLITKRDETARIWDSMSGKPIGKPLKHPGGVSSAAFSPDGSRILTVPRMARRASGTSPRASPLHAIDETLAGDDRANFSPDGTRIVPLSPGQGNYGMRRRAAVWAVCPHPLRRMPRRRERDVQPRSHLCAVELQRFSRQQGRPRLGLQDRRGTRDFVWGTARVAPSRGSVGSFFHIRCDAHCHDLPGWRRAGVGCGNGEPIGQPLRHDRDANGFLRSVSASPDGARILTLTDKNIVRVWQTGAGDPLEKPLPAARAKRLRCSPARAFRPNFRSALWLPIFGRRRVARASGLRVRRPARPAPPLGNNRCGLATAHRLVARAGA